MEITDTLVVGGGQAGLALSRCLVARGRDHLVLERGRVAERWRSERWDSFRLLTPSWLTRLPGYRYDGPDPDGFLARDEVVDLFEGYARSFAPPLRCGVDVTAARPVRGGWRVDTADGPLQARRLVVATGAFGAPAVPGVAAALPTDLVQIHSSRYRRPAQLPPGGVLVVGAGPSGQQIARELAHAGRRVHLAVGRHRALPRRYRDRDAYWWLDAIGYLAASDAGRRGPQDGRATRRPAPGVVLAGGRGDLDLRVLAAAGVVCHGRLRALGGAHATFGDDLVASLRAADRNVERFRAAVDAYVAATGLDVPAELVAPPDVPPWATATATSLDLRREHIRTIVWATGFRPDFSWVHAPVFDTDGEPVHRRGITAAPGLAFLGLRGQHHRSSHQIDGVGADAAHLADWIVRDADPSRAAVRPVSVPA